jgi:hypothetical protein
MDYKDMYFKLAAKVADAIDILTEAQLISEEMFMEQEEQMQEEQS